MDDAVGVDPEHVAVEREVMDRAQRQPVDDGGDALGLDVGDDVRGLDERALAQRADRAAVPVGAHHVELEALLMQPDARLAGRVRAHVRSRDEPARLHVLDRQAGLEHDGARAPGSSAVTNIGATTRYWLGASARKYTSGVCSS